jgi:halimadienyl-diphosphate synthase
MSVVSRSSLSVRSARTVVAPPTVPARSSVRTLIRGLLDEIAADEDEHWGGGSISPSAYEVAWVALVRKPGDEQRLAFPETLDWLLTQQHTDGSWGPPFPHSLIPSMAALLALRRAPDPDLPTVAAIVRGRQYLHRAFGRWRADVLDTPFFEFLIPLLAGALARDGIPLPVPDLDLMRQRQEAKLHRLPLEALYAGRSSLLHALEVFGVSLDYERLRDLRAPNGSYGYSPSATAAVLLHGPEWDTAAAGWLRRFIVRSRDDSSSGAMPASYPADAFEAAWALHLLQHGGYPLDPVTSPTVRRILHWLHASLTAEGASFSRTRGLPCDVDDTALVLAVLNRQGVQVAPAVLWPYEREAHFVSYDGERTGSTSANAHVLEALLSMDDIGLPTLADRRNKVVRYLLVQRASDGSWTDKWHLSPYYGTLSCVLALARLPDPTIRVELLPTLDWLRQTQRRGGGWGMSTSTIEETAYGVLTVAALVHVIPGLWTEATRRMIRRAHSYLSRHLSELDEPESQPTLWVDKTLYAPVRVIRAAVLAALYTCAHGHNWAPPA